MMKKIPFSDVSKILSRFELSPEAAEVIHGHDTPATVVEMLKQEKLFIDLTNFYANALPMRESIWWGALAVKKRFGDLSREEKKLLDDCIVWVREPNEVMRRSIERQVATLPNESAAKWVGQSVFWSGNGSIAPIDNPVVMPVEHLFAKAVAGAVNTAAVVPEWNGYKKYYQYVFEVAMDLANGGSGLISGENV